MLKRIFQVTLGLCIASIVAFSTIAIVRSNADKSSFSGNGYVLIGDIESGESKKIPVTDGSGYKITASGMLSFKDAEGNDRKIGRQSFFINNDGSVCATDNGILLDFNDLSDNFINNYSISKGLDIKSGNGSYYADTSNGKIEFGDNLFKLSDDKYIIQSPSLTIHFSEEDIRPAEDYVQIARGQDGVVSIMTRDNLWMTVSENCYIETQNGVKVYPVSQIIDSGNYQIAVSSLAVDPDDDIVLAQAQHRRQIIPKINVNATDGKDGEDGDSGAAGDEGIQGENGIQGEIGYDGTKGEEGEEGGTGGSGSEGDMGATGIGAADEKTSYLSIPTMTFKDWNISSNGLTGSIVVRDKSDMLLPMSGDKSHPAYVTITDVVTGKEISCYETDSTYSTAKIDPAKPEFTGFYNGDGATVYFTTYNSPLTPNSLYSVSVTGYYSNSDIIFHREFVTRDFYTDSMGVFLVDTGADTDAVSVLSKTAQEYLSKISCVTVYLLTKKQNETFIKGSTDYTDRYQIYYRDGALTRIVDKDGREIAITEEMYRDPANIPLTFKGLISNYPYVARVEVVNNESGLDMLTNQKLELRTLKGLIVWADGTAPKAAYNRVTGAVELYMPETADGSAKDSIMQYICKVYRMDPDFPGDTSKAVYMENKDKILNSGEPEPVYFFLDSGSSYCFKVVALCNDNEKDIYYECPSFSNVVEISGTKMPGLKLTNDAGYPKFNMEKGTVIINLDEGSDMVVDNLRPLMLDIYADQVKVDTIFIKDDQKYYGSENEDYTEYLKAKYSVSSASPSQAVSNERYVFLDFTNLHMKTDYTINVSAYTRLGGDYDPDDGTQLGGFVKRSLGTVRFMTGEPAVLKAKMERNPQSSYNMEVKVSIGLADGETDQYSLDELQYGQLVLSLYRGSTTDGAPLAEKTLSKANEGEEFRMKDLIAEGITVTNQTFGVSLDKSSTYTLTIKDAMDRTYLTDNLYAGGANTYSVQNSATLITPQVQPPDLLKDPTKGMTVIPIYCSEVKKFDSSYDTSGLNGNTIVGYKLKANYNNVSRLAVSVTYYGLEYNQFYNALKNEIDPIVSDIDGVKVFAIKHDVENNNIPNIAVLFGGNKGEQVGTGTVDGYYVYYGGSADVEEGTKLKGMGRGFRYVFAYTAEYQTEKSGPILNYPYDFTGQYEEYKDKYGAGAENSVTLGKGVAYILNSGMQQAPKQDPTFSGYVYDATNFTVLDETNYPAAGNVNWKYYYTDKDDTVAEGGSFTYPWNDNVTPSAVGKGNTWNKVSFPVKVYSDGLVIGPKLKISHYRFSYYDVLCAVRRSGDAIAESSPETIVEIPVDYYWQKTFDDMDESYLHVTVNADAMSENRIGLEFDKIPAAVMETVLSRTFAVKVQAVSDKKPHDPVVLYVPIERTGANYAATVYSDSIASLREPGAKVTFTASLVYDSGLSGWKYADSSDSTVKGFGIQYTNNAGFVSTTAGDYFNGGNQSYIYPTKGLMNKKSGVVSALESAVGRSKYKADFKYALTEPLDNMSWYLYPVRWGVDVNGEISTDRLSSRYVSAKAASERTLDVANPEGGIEISKITPSVTAFEGNGRKYSVSAIKFDLKGFDSTASRIYLALYDDEAKARSLSNDSHHIGQDVLLDPSWLKDGSFPVKGGAVQEIMLPPEGSGLALNENTPYYVALYMVYNDDTGKKIMLINGETRGKAVYLVYTVGDVIIEKELDQTSNISTYFNKYTELSYKTNRFLGVDIEYNIFDSEEHAAVEKDPSSPTGDFKPESWEGLVLSHAEMQELTVHDLSQPDPETAPKISMLAAPAVAMSGNTIRLWLEPTSTRSKLVPGGQYYMRCSAYEGKGSGRKYVGGGVLPVRIPNTDQRGYITRIAEVGQEKIEFAFTVSDYSRAYMSSLTDNHTKGGTGFQGLYAVRFVYTDDNNVEHRIPTVYDDYVYSEEKNHQQSFILSKDTVISEKYPSKEDVPIVAGRAYTMRVYAAADMDQDGLTAEYGRKDNVPQFYTYSDLYGSLTEGSLSVGGKAVLCKSAPVFTNYLNTYWGTAYPFNRQISADVYESGFLIGQKTRKTLTGTYYMPDPEKDKDKYFFDTVSLKTFSMELDDAYGLITTDSKTGIETHVFNKISWQIQSTATAAVTSGTELYTDSKGETLLRPVKDASDNTIYVFTATIADKKDYMQNGVNYLITIQYFENETDVEPKYTYSGSVKPKNYD